MPTRAFWLLCSRQLVVHGAVLASELGDAGLPAVEDDAGAVPAYQVAANEAAREIEEKQPDLGVTGDAVSEHTEVAARPHRDTGGAVAAGPVARDQSRVRARVHVETLFPVPVELVSNEAAPR